ncbi:MAG: ABC transporter substrate-binding protein [Oligoflexales bacterium]|nr:ABC transporter substrate-binding protein [Oligoflexales bacterium]
MSLKPFAFVLLFSIWGCKSEEEKTSSLSRSAVLTNDGASIHYARSADPKTLDPVAQLDQISGSFISNLYDTLVEYHYLKRPYKLIPSLLEEMPKVSEDGKTYSFKLKKGVYFQDDACFPDGKGKELKAIDVLYTIKRFADANLNVRSWFLLDEVIEGLDEYREKTKTQGSGKVDHLTEKVSGLEKVNDYEFKIKLKRVNPRFMYSFAASSLAIVPYEAVNHYKNEFARHPVGTGPFKLEKYKNKQTMTFVRNNKYFLKYPDSGEEGDKEKGLLADAGRKLPLLSSVKIHFIPESQPQMLKFKKGELAWVGLDRDNFIKMAIKDEKGQFKLKPEEAKKYSLYTEPGLSAFLYFFNMKNPLLSQNKKLRQAIVMAIDINHKIELLRNGRGNKLYTIVPESIAGSEKDIGKLWYDYDLEAAKKLLAEAGYNDKSGYPNLTLTMAGSTSVHKKDFEFIRNSLAKIGIILKPDYKTWTTHTQTLVKGEYDLASWAWGADYPDAENFFQLFYGGNIGDSNYSFFNHAEFNNLYEEIRFMADSPEKFERLKKMMTILKEEIPFVLDYTPLISGLIQKNIKNFKRNIMMYLPFKYINVEQIVHKSD